jgi:hypothetical protein
MDRRGQVGGAAGCFSARLMQFVLHCGLIFMAYLVDIPNDGACFFTCLAHYALYCEQNSLQKSPILTTDVAWTREQLCNFLLANINLIMIADGVNQLTVEQYFVENYGPHAVERKAVHLDDSLHREILCDTFYEYIAVMRNPVAHADEIFVFAASIMFNIKLSVLEHFVPRIEDPNLKTLVEMGYPRTAAEHALQQCSGNLNDAIDFLHQHPPKSSESAVVWREDDPYNQDGAFEVCMVREGKHFVLVLPPNVPRELEPRLPPRTRKEIVAAQVIWVEHQQSHGCGGGPAAVPAKSAQPCRKHSAGGGEARVQHKPPPSFAHSQPQAVATPQSWYVKLQKFFQSLDISILVNHIVSPSGQYQTTDSDIQKRLCLLSSVAFDARRTFEQIAEAFLYNAPNITHLDFTTTHNIVTSFKIAEQTFRCTAVVFNDGHVIAFPELKNLRIYDPKRDQQRKDFYDAINSHFQNNPRVVIDKMLFEPCV